MPFPPPVLSEFVQKNIPEEERQHVTIVRMDEDRKPVGHYDYGLYDALVAKYGEDGAWSYIRTIYGISSNCPAQALAAPEPPPEFVQWYQEVCQHVWSFGDETLWATTPWASVLSFEELRAHSFVPHHVVAMVNLGFFDQPGSGSSSPA